MTVSQLEKNMSSKELTEWVAYLTIQNEDQKQQMNNTEEKKYHLDRAKAGLR